MPPKEIVDELKRALESRDPQKVLALFRDDAVMHVESLDEPLPVARMKDAVAGAYASLEDVTTEIEKVVTQGNEVACLLTGRMTFGSDYSWMGVELPVAGKSIAYEAALFLTLDDAGKIREMTRVRDNWTIVRELGLEPALLDELMEKTRQALARGESIER